MTEKFIAEIKQLIRTSRITGIDRIVCGDQSCLDELFHIRIRDGKALLLCAVCGRESVEFHLDEVDEGRN